MRLPLARCLKFSEATFDNLSHRTPETQHLLLHAFFSLASNRAEVIKHPQADGVGAATVYDHFGTNYIGLPFLCLDALSLLF